MTTYKKPIYDAILPYPYLPDYTGTYQDIEKAARWRLKLLLENLEKLEAKYGENKTDISLLADIEKCQCIVREMLE